MADNPIEMETPEFLRRAGITPPTLRVRVPVNWTVVDRLPDLPGTRAWHVRPEKIGDTGLDVNGDRWIWLPQGLRWSGDELSDALVLVPPQEVGGDIMASIRDVARGS